MATENKTSAEVTSIQELFDIVKAQSPGEAVISRHDVFMAIMAKYKRMEETLKAIAMLTPDHVAKNTAEAALSFDPLS